MEELVRKINANYLALANLERIKKQNSMPDDCESYVESKKSIMEVLNQHLQEYKNLTGIEFELSEEINNVLKEYGN
jgi:DNA-binding transcriptional regulator GbsR (MarR family)